MNSQDRSQTRWERTIGIPSREFGSVHDVISRTMCLYDWCGFSILQGSPEEIAASIRDKQKRMIYDSGTLHDSTYVLEFSASWLGTGAVLRERSIAAAVEVLDVAVSFGMEYCSLVGRTLVELHAKGANYEPVPRIVKFADCPNNFQVRTQMSEMLDRLGFVAEYTNSLGGLIKTEPLLLITPREPEKFPRGRRVSWI